jgi:hypothetical protein
MTTTTNARKFSTGTPVWVTVWCGDSYEHVEVRGVMVFDNGRDGVRMADLRTGTVATFTVADDMLRRRDEKCVRVWTCAVGGKDIFTWI